MASPFRLRRYRYGGNRLPDFTGNIKTNYLLAAFPFAIFYKN